MMDKTRKLRPNKLLQQIMKTDVYRYRIRNLNLDQYLLLYSVVSLIVSLALKSPYGKRSVKYVLYCIVLRLNCKKKSLLPKTNKFFQSFPEKNCSLCWSCTVAEKCTLQRPIFQSKQNLKNCYKCMPLSWKKCLFQPWKTTPFYKIL